MSPFKEWFLILGTVTVFLTSSCANDGQKPTPARVGYDFKHSNVSGLELRQLKSPQHLLRFGLPRISERTTTPDGNYEIVKYEYGEADMNFIAMRRLMLEFKNGDLNAYLYMSSFANNEINFDAYKASAIKTGSSSKADVLAILGTPHGKAECPSLLPDFKQKCDKGSECWAWVSMPRVVRSNRNPASVTKVIVTFDLSGKVTDFQTDTLVLQR